MTTTEEKAGEQVVRGTVARVTFHNPENGYSVLQLSTSGSGEPITVVGMARAASVGAHLVVRGAYIQHPKFGRQLSASSITETAPSSAEGIEKYLGSGLIKGIGPKTAQRLVEEFGENTLERIVQDSDSVARLPGVGRKKALLLKGALAEQKDVQEIMRFLLEHHVSQGLAHRIFEKFGNRSIEIISKDPYLLARELRGVGFATADTIGLNLGIAPEAPQRLKAGLYFALERAVDDGHCYLTDSQVMQKACFLLGLSDEQTHLLAEPLTSLIEEGYLVRSLDAVYLKHLYRAEEFVAQFVADRAEPRSIPDIDPQDVDEALAEAERHLGLEFSGEQRDAVHAATTARLLIITGGPGCGKTTLIRALALMFKKSGMRLMLGAPTGRAAQRMGAVCEMSASTIHRMLRYDPVNRSFLHGINDPLPADAIIIDEASMIDLLLARDLFTAIPRECTLILVGDKDQLPSVGPGRVFADLIAVPRIRTIALSRLYRRNDESAITSVAHLINAGVMPDIPEPDGVTKTDAYFLPRPKPEDAALTIERLVAESLPKKFGFEGAQIAVLTPSNRGELGTERLNERLQARLNPPGSIDEEQEVTLHGMTLRVGDRVCQRVNNYQIDEVGVFNGDTGQVTFISRRDQAIHVQLWDGRQVKYSFSDMSQLSLAYALTVHRSQGSEVPCVVLALHDSHFTLLDRQLIYTAVTRAKKLLVIVGSKRALSMAVKRSGAKRRNSKLHERVQLLSV